MFLKICKDHPRPAYAKAGHEVYWYWKGVDTEEKVQDETPSVTNKVKEISADHYELAKTGMECCWFV